ncbi:hypothetical protein [Sphingomonas sp.]|uniref:hypothetical protein n=1 Tax=Sphingomonas sp. TaxID=28214 RepID=UPI003F7278A2
MVAGGEYSAKHYAAKAGDVLTNADFIAVNAALGDIGTVADNIADVSTAATNIANITIVADNIGDIAALVAPVAPVTLTLARTLTGEDVRPHLYIEVDSPDLMVTQIPIPSNSEEALAIGAAFVGTNTGTGLIQFVPDTVGDAVITPAKAGYVYVPPGGSFRVEQRATDEWVLSGDLTNEANAFTVKLFFDPSTDAAAFQERTGASATTAAGDGDVMGTLVNKGTVGGYAVARTDVRRPTRQIDDDGFWCFVTDGNSTATNADFLEIQGVSIDFTKLNLYVAFKPLAYQFGDGIISLAPFDTSGDQANDRFAISQNALSASIPTDFAFNMGVSPNRLSVGVQGMNPERVHVVEWRCTANNVAKTITVDGFEITSSGAVGLPALANTTALTTATVRLIMGANPGNEGQNGAIQHSNTAFYGVIATDAVLNTAQRASIRAYLESKAHAAIPDLPTYADLTALETARTTLITEVFGSGTLPTDIATLATDASPPVTGLTGLNNVKIMTIPGEADTNIKPRLWTPNSPRTDVVALVWAGHAAGWNANGIRDQVIQPMLTAGVPIVSMVLPDGPNNYTSGSPTNHAANLTAYAEWARQAVVAVNTLLDTYPGAEVIMTGISGGGWATMLCAALDARITKSVQFVGSMPSDRYVNVDYEQWLTEISADYYDLYLMAAADGRRHIQVLHEFDDAGFSRAAYEAQPPYAEGLAALAEDLGGYFDLQILDGYSAHAINAEDSAILMAELP